MNARLFRYASVGAMLALSLGSALPTQAAPPRPNETTKAPSKTASPAAPMAGSAVVFDSLIYPQPPNVPSQPFQAQQTFEFGDRIALAGTSRIAAKVTILMSTWSRKSDYPAMTDPAGWTHPITLKLYTVNLSGPTPAPGTVIAAVTQVFKIPWRPIADPTCPDTGYGAGSAWRSPSDGLCYNGFAFPITFDLTSLNAVLPNEIIYGISYNTQSYGVAPIGVDGPYNSLNVGAGPVVPSVGTDVDPNGVFWNTITPGWYCDSGAAGAGVFRQDTGCWAPYVPNVRFEATSLNNLVMRPGDVLPLPNNISSSAFDAAPGYGSGSFVAAAVGLNQKSDIYLTPEALFFREINVSDVAKISYWTKIGTTHAVNPADWFLALYTKPYAGDLSTPAWYGDRIGAEPYFSANIADPANTWNMWSTDGASNKLRFFESTQGAPGATFGSYTDPDWATFSAGNALSGQPYAGHKVLYFSIQTGNPWANGFTGKLDGLRIELTDGSVATVNFEPNAGLTIVPATKLVGVGASFSLDLVINSVSDLYGYQFAVTFDHTKLSATGAFENSFFNTAGGYTPGGWNADCVTVPGTCKFASTKLAGAAVNGTGTLARINFTALQPGVWPVAYDPGTVVLGDQNAIPISTGTQNAVVTVYGTATFNGVVKLQGRATPITPGTVVAVDTSGTFLPTGVYFDAVTGAYSLVVPALAVGTNWQITADHSLYLYNRTTVAGVVPGSPTTLATQMLWGGDATNDDQVKNGDLTCVGGSFLLAPVVCGTTGSSDLNGDGIVNILDLVLVGSNYDKVSPQPWQ